MSRADNFMIRRTRGMLLGLEVSHHLFNEGLYAKVMEVAEREKHTGMRKTDFAKQRLGSADLLPGRRCRVYEMQSRTGIMPCVRGI